MCHILGWVSPCIAVGKRYIIWMNRKWPIYIALRWNIWVENIKVLFTCIIFVRLIGWCPHLIYTGIYIGIGILWLNGIIEYSECVGILHSICCYIHIGHIVPKVSCIDLITYYEVINLTKSLITVSWSKEWTDRRKELYACLISCVISIIWMSCWPWERIDRCKICMPVIQKNHRTGDTILLKHGYKPVISLYSSCIKWICLAVVIVCYLGTALIKELWHKKVVWALIDPKCYDISWVNHSRLRYDTLLTCLYSCNCMCSQSLRICNISSITNLSHDSALRSSNYKFLVEHGICGIIIKSNGKSCWCSYCCTGNLCSCNTCIIYILRIEMI